MIVEAINNVCAKAPTGIEKYADMLLGWVKYGVAAVIIAAGFISVGALVVGKLGSMSRAAQMGVKVVTVPGSALAFKVTNPVDLALAEAVLRGEAQADGQHFEGG